MKPASFMTTGGSSAGAAGAAGSAAAIVGAGAGAARGGAAAIGIDAGAAGGGASSLEPPHAARCTAPSRAGTRRRRFELLTSIMGLISLVRDRHAADCRGTV